MTVSSNISELGNTARVYRGAWADMFPSAVPDMRTDFDAAVLMERRDPNRPYHLLLAIDARTESMWFIDDRTYPSVGAVNVLERKMAKLRDDVAKRYPSSKLMVTVAVNTGDGISILDPTDDLTDFKKAIDNANAGLSEQHTPIEGVGRSRIVDLLNYSKKFNQDNEHIPFDAAIVSVDHIDSQALKDVHHNEAIDTTNNMKEAGKNFGAPIFGMLQTVDDKIFYRDQQEALHAMMVESGVNGWPLNYQSGGIKFKDWTYQDNSPWFVPPEITWPQVRKVGLRGAGLGLIAALALAVSYWRTQDNDEPVAEPAPVEEEQVIYTFSGEDERFKFDPKSSELSSEFENALAERVPALSENPQDLVAVGHASRDFYSVNDILSGNRAKAVAGRLGDLLGDSISIDVVQCGQEYPLYKEVLVDGNPTEVLDMEASRRVTLERADGYVLPEGCDYVVD